jgi:uncharacterized membrane protein
MSPERFRILVSTILIVGVVAAASLMLVAFVGAVAVGWGGSLVGAASADAAGTDFGALPAGLAALRPIALGQLGLLVLLATPVVRVAASVLGFALEGDRLYVAITAVVLVVLLASIFFVR